MSQVQYDKHVYEVDGKIQIWRPPEVSEVTFVSTLLMNCLQNGCTGKKFPFFKWHSDTTNSHEQKYFHQVLRPQCFQRKQILIFLTDSHNLKITGSVNIILNLKKKFKISECDLATQGLSSNYCDHFLKDKRTYQSYRKIMLTDIKNIIHNSIYAENKRQ